MKQGFSLVELSIVLVILGLLTGGVLTGQNLIRGAELRSITTQHQGFMTAAFSFRDKYLALPGDLRNASNFWVGATNGDGDNTLEPATADGGKGEMYGTWQQLALAGIIEGTYSGNSGAGGAGLQDSVIGTNVPAGKLNSTGWTIIWVGSQAVGSTTYFTGSYGNSLVFGAKTADDITNAASIKAEEAWNVDTKIDDGDPEEGKVRVPETRAAAGETACSNTTTGAYALTNTAAACSLVFTGL